MRTTQKPTNRTGRHWAAACLVAALAGCTPPEQKALEEGSRLLAAGNPAGALQQLEVARERIENHPNLKTNLLIVGKLHNQIGLAHRTLAKDKTGAAKTGELEEAKKSFDLAIEKGGQESRIQAYQNRAWLHLEAEKWEEAANDFGSLYELGSGSKSTNRVFDLWLEKGIAEYGAKRIDEARKSFGKIPNDPRAQNNLGNIAWSQKRYKEAAACFEKAINLDNKNTLALRNLGAVRQQMKQYPAALEAYHGYLDLVPKEDADIRALVNQLEDYLKPEPPPEPEPEPVVAEVEPEPEPEPAEVTIVEPEPEPEPVVAEVEPEPEPEPAEVTIVEPPAEEPEPAALEPEVVTVVKPAPLPVPLAKPEPTEPIEPEPVVAEAEATTAEPEPSKNWKQKLNPRNWFGDDKEEAATEAKVSQAETAPDDGKDWKQRINPRNWFGDGDEKPPAKPKKNNTRQISWRSNAPIPTTPLPGPGPVAKASTNAVRVASILPSAVAFPRYKYLNPALPDAGDRPVAKTYFDDGAAAQKSEEWQRAKAAYIEAAKADPAWFDARFELGQAAFYTGDTDLALQAFEHALAIDPNDGPARFNFAMSLAQGSYYADAAREFETFLQFDPDNAQAHFEAGKLYAERLNDVAKANIHYKRVIGLQPGHPEAVNIRYWLIRNKAN
ncbi:MAG: tetratricopeptide repeat protein [Verrucomicrobiota bacterium]|nr:tetratricopeptide repeat protein [Verrucomicrobiota bacterium]